MRASRCLCQLIIVGGVSVVFAQASCGSTRIASQEDADQVSGACSTLNGDIVIEQSAKGDIRLDGIKSIKGAIKSDGSSSIESLSSTTLETISGDFFLQGLEELTSLEFIQLESIGGDLHLDSLKKVENITFSNLTSVANFNLTTAPVLINFDIDKLTNISAPDSSFTLAGVGINWISNIFATVHSAVFKDNTISRIQFENMTITENLFILDNDNLEVIRLPNNMSSNTWDTIQISNNPYLRSFSILYHDASKQWPWDIKHIHNMTITENSLTSDFFETSTPAGVRRDPGIDSIDNLVVTSTDVFNCSVLDTLRIEGVIKDKYECQGRTVAIGGDTKDNASAPLGVSMIWLVAGLALHTLFMSP